MHRISYAEALAMRDGSATVDLPIRLSDGSIGQASILIGPASQLITQSESDSDDELLDPELVQRLARATAELSVPRPVASDGSEPVAYDIGELDVLDYDLDPTTHRPGQESATPNPPAKPVTVKTTVPAA